MGHRGSLDVLEKRQISCPTGIRTPDRLAPELPVHCVQQRFVKYVGYSLESNDSKGQVTTSHVMTVCGGMEV